MRAKDHLSRQGAVILRRVAFLVTAVLLLVSGVPGSLAHASTPPFAYYNPSPQGEVYYDRPVIALPLVLGRLSATAVHATLTLDGRRVPVVVGRDGAVAYDPPPLAPGPHVAVFSVRVVVRGTTWTVPQAIARFTISRHALTRLPAPSRTVMEMMTAANSIRALAGERPWMYSPALEAAAQAHANFYDQNRLRYARSSLSPHEELRAWPGFTRSNVLARDMSFGYDGVGASEDMAFGYPMSAALAVWMDSVFHRIPILDPGTDLMGFGLAGATATGDGRPVSNMDIGSTLAASEPTDPTQAVAYPVNGQMGVPTAFIRNEQPDPLAPFPSANGKTRTGSPVTLTFYSPRVAQIHLISAVIEPLGGRPLKSWVLTPQNAGSAASELGFTIAILPREPLRAGTTYRVHIRGLVTDTSDRTLPFDQRWEFATTQLPTELPLAPVVTVINGRRTDLALPAFKDDGQWLVPLRLIARPLHIDLLYNPEYPDYMTVTHGRQQIRLDFGTFGAWVDGIQIDMPAPALKLYGDGYVPVLTLGEALHIPVSVVVSRGQTTIRMGAPRGK